MKRKHHITWKIKICILLLLSGSLLQACRSGAGKQPQSAQPAGSPAYATAPVRELQPEYEITLPGELEPYEQVDLHAKVEGFVRELHVDRGERVSKGDLLATLEAPEMQQRYLSDKSAEEKMHSDYLIAKQRYQRLKEASLTSGAVAAIELEQARGAMESAESAYKAAQAGTGQSGQLREYLRITAPFDGVVTQRNVSIGALTGTPGSPAIFSMAQNRRLRLLVSLPEKHATAVTENMQAHFSVSGIPGRSFSARLSRSSDILSSGERALYLEFDVDNSRGQLQAGAYARVVLHLKRQEPTHWVPQESVLHTQSGTFVMTLQEDSIGKIPVDPGIRLDSLTEVFGALGPQDKVLRAPSEEIRLGKVNP